MAVAIEVLYRLKFLVACKILFESLQMRRHEVGLGYKVLEVSCLAGDRLNFDLILSVSAAFNES